MSTETSGWERFSQTALSLFSQREVKTPLAFYFRLALSLVVITLAAIYLVSAELRFRVFMVAIVSLAVLGLVVTLFTIFNVKNLVYGESGHRAETKLKFGTEKREIPIAELGALPGTVNPHPSPTALQDPAPLLSDEGAK